MTQKIFKPDSWVATTVGTRFITYKLTLAKNEFTVVATSVPFQCRFPEPNDGLGVNTYRGNSFVKGRFSILPHASTVLERVRGEEMVTVRWATDGGAEFMGLEDDNEFWCINLRDPTEGIYLQTNHPLEPGQTAVIPNRSMERNIFVLQGNVKIEGTPVSSFKHIRLTKDQAYQITNDSDEPAFVLHFYQVTPSEFIAAGEPTLPEATYRMIPILQESYWSAEDESV